MFILNRQERQVVLFLFVLALAGAGINFFAKKNPPLSTAVFWGQNLGKVDLNSADKPALMEISGIAEKTAQRILEYRRENGNFTRLEELKNIKGMTDYRYAKIKDSLFVK